MAPQDREAYGDSKSEKVSKRAVAGELTMEVVVRFFGVASRDSGCGYSDQVEYEAQKVAYLHVTMRHK